MSLPKYLCIMLYVKLMLCSCPPCIYGQLEEGVSLSWNWYGVVVCHGSVVNWRRGWDQSVMKIMQCNGLPGIHVQLTGGSIGVAFCHVSLVNWRRGWGQSVMKIRQCNGLPDSHAQLRRVYLISLCTSYISVYHAYLDLNTSSENMNSYLMSMCTASCSLYLTTMGVYLTGDLGTSSENMNSYLMSMCTSSCSLHLTTMGGISDTLSGHFIWKYELISSFWVWVSVCTSSGHFIWNGGVYLTAYLNTSSENMNSFPHFGFGSQCALHLKLGGISDSLSGYFIWQVDLVVHFIWKLDLIPLSVSSGLSLTT